MTNTIRPSGGQPPPLPPRPPLTRQPSHRKKEKSAKAIRLVRLVFRSFPILTPSCKLPYLSGGLPEGTRLSTGGLRITGTLYGYRNGKVSLSLQETPRALPTLVLELSMQTNVLHRELSHGMVRIALECEKRSEKDRVNIFDEIMWTMYYNGKTNGYAIKREAREEDLRVMEILWAVSMGAGVIPGRINDVEGGEPETVYMRAHFERVIGSRDSETLYMLSPDDNTTAELSIFFVRV